MNNNKSVNIVKKEKCCGCHACYNACPKNAIDMIADEEGFLYPDVSSEKCINCGKCLSVCPSMASPHLNIGGKAYACYAKNHEEHLSSSSGGIFAVLARKFLKSDGFVFGASFNDRLEVEHLGIAEADDLYRLKGTKYVQSRIGTSYACVREELLKGSKVLFSGTPCQVAGLKSYLGKDDDNLLCIDLICHGVPSPAVWRRYLCEQFGENNVIAMQFRDKTKGISNVTLDYMLKNGGIIRESYMESPYIKGFTANFYTRPSCFHCDFKGVQRCSDITIGDFWSIKEFHPEISNQYGVSAVIVHTEKGKHWLETVVDQLILCNAKVQEISVWNECLLVPVKENPYRSVFFEKWKYTTVADTVLQLDKQKTNAENSVKLKGKLGDRIVRRIRKWLV